jgi:hypothetical protein
MDSLAQEFEFNQSALVRMALPTAVAELFAYRLAKSTEITNVAPVKVTTREPKDFNDFAKSRNGLWIISKRVPKALPLYFLSRKISTSPFCKRGRYDLLIMQTIEDIAEWLRPYFIELLDKRCPISREQYADFPEEAESSREVIEAATWDSPKRLLTYCFSAFLHSSHPHNSNVLVDMEGRLWQKDFEKIVYRDDVADIAELYANVRKSERVLEACRRVSGISEQALTDALSGINSEYWQREDAEFKHHTSAIEYFVNRLRVWKKYFTPVESR